MLSQDLNSQSRSFSTTLPNVLNKGTTTFSPISITHSPLIYSLRSDHYLSIFLVPEKKKMSGMTGEVGRCCYLVTKSCQTVL